MRKLRSHEKAQPVRAGIAGLITVLAAVSGCASISRNAAPKMDMAQAHIVGMPPNIRSLGLTRSQTLQSDFAKALVDGGRKQACDWKGSSPIICVLIISGGGGFGAYGAGLLNGWTASGNRPKFKIVTGISTGSLIAPFAFLGSDWDDELKAAFTGIRSDKDVVASRGLIGVLFGEALTSTAPLKRLIERFVTPKMLVAIAREHRSGRRLYVGTTNMDAQRFTVWNLGAIAASGRPEALALVRKVLLASSSVPILMPPVMFDVSVKEKKYDEMHSDGGVTAQFFVPLVVIDLPGAIKEAQAKGFRYTPRPRMYVIRNDKFTPNPKHIKRSALKIGARTISTMIQTMGRADLFLIFSIARARGGDFLFTQIPESFIWKSKQEFDGPEMKRLFAVGYKRASNGSAWSRRLPGLFSRNTGSGR